MDPITHALSGMAVAQMGLKRRYAVLIIVLSTLAPDIDYIARFWGIQYLLEYHRGITHSLFAGLVFALMIALIFKNKTGFVYSFGISLLGYCLHIAFDLTNPYGTMVLAPLSFERYALDLTFIIDLFVSLGLLATVILGRLHPKRAVIISICFFVLLSGYFYARYYAQTQTRAFVKARIDAHSYRLLPMPNSLTGWWFVAKSGDVYSTGIADILLNRIFMAETYKEVKNSTLVEKSKEHPLVRSFLGFAKTPVAVVSDNTVKWKELSYSFIDKDRFTVKVVYDEKARIKHASFGF